MALGKKVLAAGAIVAFSFAVFAATQHPSQPTNTNMKGSSMKRQRPLKMQSEDKMIGRVKSVMRVHEPDGTKVHILLDTPEGMRKIIVGPASYLDRSRLGLQNNDKITVYGYEMMVNGDQMWIATKIEKNGHVVNLRQQNGQANWNSSTNGNPNMQH